MFFETIHKSNFCILNAISLSCIAKSELFLQKTTYSLDVVKSQFRKKITKRFDRKSEYEIVIISQTLNIK